MKIIVDGNDGTGKSTLVKKLKEHGYKAADRGLPSKLSDDPDLPIPEDEIYIILDTDIETCQTRLKEAEKNLKEKYHNKEALKHYRRRFLEVAKKLPRSILIEAGASKKEILRIALIFIEKNQ